MLGATVTSNGGSALTDQGITWGTSPNPRTHQTSYGSAPGGTWTQFISGLPTNTLIYFDGYATNALGTTYTSDGSFTPNPTHLGPVYDVPGSTGANVSDPSWGVYIVSKQPIITFRSSVSPYTQLSSPFIFSETIANQSGLPVLAGDKSDVTTFRIYNNFALQQDISTAYNVTVTTYDGISHTASTSLVTQQWVNLQENGYGMGATTANNVTFYQDNPVFIGGTNVKTFAIGADGTTNSQIPAYTTRNGCGFIEVNMYCSVPLGQSTSVSSGVLSISFDWTS
jgi:hypothetical protein